MLSSTCSFILDLGMVLVRSSRRSASVDLPWSMGAMMQKFRTDSRRFKWRGSEPDAERDGEAGIRSGGGGARQAGTRKRAQVGVEVAQVRVDVGVRHLEEVDRGGPPDVVDLQVVVLLLVVIGFLVLRRTWLELSQEVDCVAHVLELVHSLVHHVVIARNDH